MAINPSTSFPSNTTTPDAAYPYGGAQDVAVPGDGSGTPWVAILLNDVFGFQQGILSEAGVTPSGVSDTADASQYLDALKTIMGGVEHVSRTINIPADFPATYTGLQDALDSIGATILPNVVVKIEIDDDTINIGANCLNWKSYVGGGIRRIEAVNKTGPGAGSKNVTITGTGAPGFPDLAPYDNTSPQTDRRYTMQVGGGDFTLLGDIEFILTGSSTVTNCAAIAVSSGNVNVFDCIARNQSTSGTSAAAIQVFNSGVLVASNGTVEAPSPYAGGNSAAIAAFAKGQFEAVTMTGSAEYAYLVDASSGSYASNGITGSIATELKSRGEIYS